MLSRDKPHSTAVSVGCSTQLLQAKDIAKHTFEVALQIVEYAERGMNK